MNNENILKSVTIKTNEGEFVVKVDYDEPFESPREWDDTNASNMICFHSRYDLGDKHNFSDNIEFLADLISENCDKEAILLSFFKKEYNNIRHVYVEDDNSYDILYTDKNGKDIRYSTVYTDDIEDEFEKEIGEMYEDFYHNDWKDLVDISDMLEIIENHTEVVLLPLYLYDHSGITMNTTGFSCNWDSGQVGYIYSTKKLYEKHYGGNWTVERIVEDLQNEVKTYDKYLRGDIYWFKIEKVVKCECCNHVEYEEIDSCGGFYDMESLIDHVQSNFDKEYHDEISKNLE